MTFIINSIKEGFNKKYNAEFLLGVDSPLLARKLLEETGIIVLSIKEYKEPNPKFGNIYFQINFQQQDITIVSNFQGDLHEACNFFLMLGFQITNINSFTNPVSAEETKKIITDSVAANEKRKQEEEKITEEKVKAETKIYESAILQVDKQIIEWMFHKIKNTIILAQGLISGKDLKKLRDKEDELKKLKLGTNHERIKELIQELTAMIEIIETDYYAANKDQEKPIFAESIVTNADVQRNIDILDKVQHLKEIGGKIKPKEQDYLLLGKYTFFIRFLSKDLAYLFTTTSHLTNIIYNIYDLLEIAFIFILILIGSYITLDPIFLFSDNLNHNYFYITTIKLGIWGILLRLARHLRKKNLAILIALIPAIIILYYIILSFITNNFSL